MLLLAVPTAGSGTFTVLGRPDPVYGRTEDHSSQSIDVGDWHVWGPFDADGFRQADGDIYIECSANMNFTVFDINGYKA
jgi:hypothetical protein